MRDTLLEPLSEVEPRGSWVQQGVPNRCLSTAEVRSSAWTVVLAACVRRDDLAGLGHVAAIDTCIVRCNDLGTLRGHLLVDDRVKTTPVCFCACGDLLVLCCPISALAVMVVHLVSVVVAIVLTGAVMIMTILVVIPSIPVLVVRIHAVVAIAAVAIAAVATVAIAVIVVAIVPAVLRPSGLGATSASPAKLPPRLFCRLLLLRLLLHLLMETLLLEFLLLLVNAPLLVLCLLDSGRRRTDGHRSSHDSFAGGLALHHMTLDHRPHRRTRPHGDHSRLDNARRGRCSFEWHRRCEHFRLLRIHKPGGRIDHRRHPARRHLDLVHLQLRFFDLAVEELLPGVQLLLELDQLRRELDLGLKLACLICRDSEQKELGCGLRDDELITLLRVVDHPGIKPRSRFVVFLQLALLRQPCLCDLLALAPEPLLCGGLLLRLLLLELVHVPKRLRRRLPGLIGLLVLKLPLQLEVFGVLLVPRNGFLDLLLHLGVLRNGQPEPRLARLVDLDL
mmetsp:Transcript_59860/g.171755  ORF Transcript_59860/g.171755 Transcript_59860/m.171755 type:complete len:505 (+) Transcript_59860:766-2280(+)